MLVQPYNQPYSQPHPQSGPVVGLQSQQMAMAQPPPPSLFHDGSAPVFRACASAMQRPTLTNVRIRSTRDANQIFYAVARNMLPMTVRRLDAEERRAIVSGNVYVWEERGATSEATGLGIERWTDGMRWSPSRVRDEFLFYHQKEMDPEEAADLPPTRWARIVRPKATGSDGSSSDASPDKIPHQRALNDPEKLIKQTYSVLVALPEDMQRGVLRKWHLTAYFTQATVDDLSTVDEVLPTPHVMVPEGLFRSARAGKMRRDTAAGRQQQQRQISFAQGLGPDAAGPSGSTPASAYLPSGSVSSPSPFSPQAASYAHMTPHVRSHVQYSAFVQEEDVRMPAQMQMQVDAHRPQPGVSYTIAPGPPQPPPPPQGQGAISAQARGIGITYTRAPREREREREGEPMQQLQRVSPQRIPPALPNAFDPARQRVVVPTQPRSPSYSHPYANAVPSHLLRTAGASVGSTSTSTSTSTGASARPPVSKYYSPAKPIAPIEITVPRHTQPLASPARAGPQRSSFAHEDVDYAGTADVEVEMEMEMDYRFPVQREPAVGRARISSSPSPRRKSLHLPSVPRGVSPSSLPSSVSCPSVAPGPRPGPGSGVGLGLGLGPSTALGSGPAQGLGTGSGSAHLLTPKPSPVAGKLSLEEERARSLVPLDSLENAVFPRRDPTDDALLRRFNALRTTPSASGAMDE